MPLSLWTHDLVDRVALARLIVRCKGKSTKTIAEYFTAEFPLLCEEAVRTGSDPQGGDVEPIGAILNGLRAVRCMQTSFDLERQYGRDGRICWHTHETTVLGPSWLQNSKQSEHPGVYAVLDMAQVEVFLDATHEVSEQCCSASRRDTLDAHLIGLNEELFLLTRPTGPSTGIVPRLAAAMTAAAAAAAPAHPNICDTLGTYSAVPTCASEGGQPTDLRGHCCLLPGLHLYPHIRVVCIPSPQTTDTAPPFAS